MFILKHSLLLALTFLYLNAWNRAENIVVRSAVADDLESLIEIDIRISYEHFKPIFTKHYAHLSIGQDPDGFLELDIKNDIETFHKCVHNTTNDQRLLIAYDNLKKTCIGFIIFHKDNAILEIDLLMIEKEYRNLGIGKQLMQHALRTFNNITSCSLYVLKFGNERTIQFYESMGFVNLGEPNTDKKIVGTPFRDLYVQCQLNIKTDTN